MTHRRPSWALLIGLLAFVTGPAAATPMDPGDLGILVTVDGESQTVAVSHDDTSFWLDSDVQLDFSSGASILFDSAETYGFFDPVINFAVGVTDFGAASTFHFSLEAPLAPQLTGNNAYTAALGGFFTDGAADGGSIAVAGDFGVMDATVNGTAVTGLGGNTGFGPIFAPYGVFTDAGTIDCDAFGTCDTFGIEFGFTGSGGGDTYALNGRFELNAEPDGPTPLPEPGAALVFGAGLLLVSHVTRRQRA